MVVDGDGEILLNNSGVWPFVLLRVEDQCEHKALSCRYQTFLPSKIEPKRQKT